MQPTAANVDATAATEQASRLALPLKTLDGRQHRAPKKTSDATSPFAIRCVKDHSPTPERKGCRVIRRMPRAGFSAMSSASLPAAVGVGVMMPTAASRNASSMSTSAGARNHSGEIHTTTSGERA